VNHVAQTRPAAPKARVIGRRELNIFLRKNLRKSALQSAQICGKTLLNTEAV
jgi:hypothetical protein